MAQPDRDRVLHHPTRGHQARRFAGLAALGDRLARFEDRYNQTATPFDWRFSTTDLTAMLERVDPHRHREAALVA